MSGYPWSVLGLDGPATEKEIRSAYARRLKIVRPDTDAKGFQNLVEARGYAVELARSREDDALLEALEEAALEMPLPATDPAGEVTRDAHIEAISGQATDRAPVIVHPADGQPEALPPVPITEQIVAAPVTIVLEASPSRRPSFPFSSEPLPPPATGEPSRRSRAWNANAQAPADIAASIEPVLLSPDEVLVRLRVLLAREDAAPPSFPAPDDVQRVLADLGRLPRPVRTMLEPDIVRAIAAILQPPIPEKRSWLAKLMSRSLPVRSASRQQARAAAAARRSLLVTLDEEFGWTTSDRSVYRYLAPQQAQRLMTEVHTGLREARLARDGVPSRWDGDGLPILDTSDLQAFFGSEQAHYGELYQEARAARKWQPHWRPWLVVLCPVWAVGLKNGRFLGLWFAALFVTGIGLAAIERHLAPALSEASVNVRGALTALANLAAFAPPLALHLYVAGYAHRIELDRLARLSRAADRKGLIAADERSHFMRRHAPKFRFENERAKSGGFFGNWQPSTWFWVFFVYAIIKLLSLLGGK